MATTEERFRALEEFRTETLHAYREMAYETTVLMGLMEDAIKRQAALERKVDELHELVDFRFNQVIDEQNSHAMLLHQILQKLDEGK